MERHRDSPLHSGFPLTSHTAADVTRTWRLARSPRHEPVLKPSGLGFRDRDEKQRPGICR